MAQRVQKYDNALGHFINPGHCLVIA